MSRIPWLLLLLTACTESADPVFCPGVIWPAIEVNLIDGVTGSRGLPGILISAESRDRRFGSVRDGGFVDSLRVFGLNVDTLASVQAAPGRPGTYDVLVRIEGYRDRQMFGVVVERGVCGVQTVTLEAVLQPS